MTKPDAFHEFLRASGAVLLDPTSEWEVARWSADGRTCVVYRSKKRGYSFSDPEAQEAYAAFLDKKHYQIVRKGKRRKSDQVVATLLHRDGCGCFYCGQPIGMGEESLEHLLSIAHGGNNHPANLVLTHHACNQRAGDLPLIEKVRLRDQMRSESMLRRAAA